MAVSIAPTEIPGVLLLESPVFEDSRGFFTEVFNAGDFRAAGFDRTFLQDNLSCSSKGTVRGLHFQIEPHGQGKLVRCLQGSVYDVAVDIREGSPTFGRWVGRTLTRENGRALWVPVGFAHGFLALEDASLVLYKCTTCYAPHADRSILYNDPAIGIEWPVTPSSISDKDARAPLLEDADYNFVYEAAGTQ